MDAGLDTQAGPNSTDVAQRLRARDPDALASFLGSWSGVVDRYCRAVCEPGLVAEAVEVTFADFLEKVDEHPIRDSHLESALKRSTRLTAAEAARIDWEEPGPLEDDEPPLFDCELTPLLLAGSPRAPASVEARARMDEHLLACARCQASASRFSTAEDAFSGSKEADVPDEVLEALLERFSEPDVESDPLPGTTIGGFRVVAISMEDADGVAFCTAVDEHAETVALRLAPADGDPDFTARFLRDTRRLVGLAHPSLPSVRAVGKSPDGAYIVTEELHSRSLASVVERGLPTKQAIRMLGEVADAVDAAHAAGLLHRQLRPANVVVGAWLVVRPLVVNFALGRSWDVVRDGEQTPYLSPEELQGQPIGPAADRYALACTLFEFLTGRPPFGTSRDEAVHGHLRDPPPRASEARPDLPPALDAVFERALSKSPGERFASGAELASEVARAMFGSPIPTPSLEAGHLEAPPAESEPAASAETADVDEELDDVVAPDAELSDSDREPEAELHEAEAPGAAAGADRVWDSDAAPHPGEDSDIHGMEAVPLAASGASENGPPPDVAEGRRTGVHQRRRLIAAAGVAAVGVVVAVVALVGGGSSERDRSSSPERTAAKPERTPAAPAGEEEAPASVKPSRTASPPVALAGTKATDYDPNGGNGEQPEKVGALIDGDVETEWQTELYPRGRFGPGVGAYIAIPRAQSLKQIEIRTTTPGWDAEIYGASAGPPPALPAPGWTKLGSRSQMRKVERIDLRTDSRPVRYCLIWITKLPTGGLVSIAEIGLFR